MKELDPLKFKSVEVLENYSDDELSEIRSKCEFYIEESSHYKVDEKKVDFLEEIIALIEYKVENECFDFSYKYLKSKDLVYGALEIALKALSSSENFPWFVLLKYRGKVVKKLIPMKGNKHFSLENEIDESVIIDLLKSEWDKIQAYAFCYSANLKLGDDINSGVLVEFGEKKSLSNDFWCQRYTRDGDLYMIDKKPKYWGEGDPRSEHF